MPFILPDVANGFFENDGLRLHYVTTGPPDGELALLLHGFPEDWAGWAAQIPVLAVAGYQVAALDLRGAGESDIAANVTDYRVSRLAGDALALMTHLGREQAHVVGHDWGASVAWTVAMLAPARVRRLIALQVPHPDIFQRGAQSLAQLRASWYAWLFQSEAAEAFFAVDRAAQLADFAFGPPDHRLIDEAAVERYRDQFAWPGRMAAGMALYRANYRPERLLAAPRLPRAVRVPTLFIYGDADRAVLPSTVATCAEAVDAEFRFERLAGASHWVQHERADEVNALLIDFLGGA